MVDTKDKQLTWKEFTKVEMRVGSILTAEVFPAANKPAYALTIDFGEFGTKKSSAQITKRYDPSSLIGMQVVAVVNFPAKQIATMMSECLILGSIEEDNLVTLLAPEQPVPNGTRIG